MENKQKRLFLAESVSISEASKLNPIFLTVDVKLCDSVANKNQEGVTEGFINDIVSRQGDHVCLPFYADVKNLLAENYEQLGHLYNKVTRKFGTQMIGSMSEFYSETEDDVVSLYGKIKVPKRDRDIVYRLVDLYEMGRFAVSVELSYDPREVILKDGAKFIDVSENSSLTGLCLVWRPACDDAYALDMVAEEADDSEEIVAESEEQPGRGETETMKDKEKITAEEQGEQIVAEAETVTEAEVQDKPEQQVAVAEGEGASDGGEGASDGGEGASDGGGSGASGDDDSGDDAESTADVEPVIDPSEQKKVVAEETQAEVLEHSVDTHESVEVCPYSGEPVHVIEYHERIIETLEDAGALIAELDKQIAELNEIKAKYDTIIAEQEAKVLAEKRESLRAFAEKQGLDIKDTAVAEAIEKLDYEKVTELSMAEEKDPEAEEKPAKQTITLASFVEMEVSDDKYGGLLNRKNK